MRKYLAQWLCACAVIASLAQASPASAQTTQSLQDLQAQIAALLAQIQALSGTQSTAQNPVTSNTTPSASAQSASGPVYACITLPRALSVGSRGSDVSALQKFLATDPSIYPEGLVTGYYGSATEAAVQRWQAKNGVVSYGDPATTGYGAIGPRTIAAMGNCNGVAPNGPSGQSCPATPSEPLTEMCQGGSWVAQYDGRGCFADWQCTGVTQPLPQCPLSPSMPVGGCSSYYKAQTDSQGCTTGWVCQSTGTSCPITVQCPAGEQVQIGANCAESCGGVVNTVTMGVNATSGVAPLTVTFTITSSGIPGGMVLQFGDGTSASVCASGTSCGSVSLSHTYTNTGTFQAILTGNNQSLGASTITVGNGSQNNNNPALSVSVSPGSVAQGSAPLQNGGAITITWSAQNAPTNSGVVLRLTGTNGKDYGSIYPGSNALSGSYSWSVPGPQCYSSGNCVFRTDSDSAYYTDAGTYYILAKLYTPSNACTGACTIAGLPGATYVATAQSNAFAITGTSNNTVLTMPGSVTLSNGQSATWSHPGYIDDGTTAFTLNNINTSSGTAQITAVTGICQSVTTSGTASCPNPTQSVTLSLNVPQDIGNSFIYTLTALTANSATVQVSSGAGVAFSVPGSAAFAAIGQSADDATQGYILTLDSTEGQSGSFTWKTQTPCNPLPGGDCAIAPLSSTVVTLQLNQPQTLSGVTLDLTAVSASGATVSLSR